MEKDKNRQYNAKLLVNLTLVIQFLDLLGASLVVPLLPEVLSQQRHKKKQPTIFFSPQNTNTTKQKQTEQTTPAFTKKNKKTTPQAARSLNVSPTTSVLINSSLYGLLQLIGSPISGAMSDRYGRRAVMLASCAATAISYLILGCADSMWMLVLSRM